jgi:hypothetical protein
MIREWAGFVLVAVATSSGPGLAKESKQRRFSSPEQAAESLFVAVQGGDEKALSQLFGGDTEILSCGDRLQDVRDRRTFVAKYREMHRTGHEDGVTILYVGAENWPFPVPLAFREGAWFFDTQNGREQIRLRRIGVNESSAIDLCRSLDGSGQAEAARLVGNTAPVDGYYFRKIPESGTSPSFVAYPAQYGSSGIMTFVVGRDGTVYERDLGSDTERAVSKLNRSPLDGSWHALQ